MLTYICEKLSLFSNTQRFGKENYLQRRMTRDLNFGRLAHQINKTSTSLYNLKRLTILPRLDFIHS